MEVAESLYGTSAPQVCDALEGGVSSAESLLLTGNPSGRRAKIVTTDAVTYGRLVVKTYCPDQLSTYDDLVADIDPTKTIEVVDHVGPQARPPAVQTVAPASGPVRRRLRRLIAWPALALMMVASVGSIAQLSDSATFGLGAVTVYLIPAILFLLPVGLVSAELATSHEGGIFVWVREAFGDRTGFQATWFVFMNSVTLYPSLLSFGAAALATAFGRPDLAGNGAVHGCASSSSVSGAPPAVVSRGHEDDGRAQQHRRRARHDRPGVRADLLHVRLAGRRASRRPTPLHLSDVTPPFDGLSSIALVVGTFVAFAGLEVNAVHIEHLKAVRAPTSRRSSPPPCWCS